MAGHPQPWARGAVFAQRGGHGIKRTGVAWISLACVLLAVTLSAVPASASLVVGSGHSTPASAPVPTGLTATAVSSSEVDLSWTGPGGSGLVGYNVYDGTSPGPGLPDRVGSLVTGTTFQVTDLAAGTTYYFEVTAVVTDKADPGQSESSRSTEAQATTPNSGGGPAAPTGLTARVVSSSEVDLSWTAPPVAPPCDDASAACYDYNVYGGTSRGGESGPVNTGLVTGTTFRVTGLHAGTTYYFEVTAVDPAGKEGGRSNEAQATTPNSGGGPAAPTGLTARVVSSSEVDLWWTGPGGGAPAGGYDVYGGTSPGGESGPVNAGLVTGTTFRVTGLHAGTTYYFEVTAVDPAGKEGGRSNEAQATTPGPGPGPGPPWGVLGGLALIVAAIVGVFVWRRVPRHWPPDAVIKAVPHAGPPLAKSIHATGRGPTHTVRIESHPGKSITTMEEVGPR